MSHISVRHLGPHEYAVEVAESDAHGNAPAALPTHHRVRVDERVVDDLGIINPDRTDEEVLVRESLEFLLEREPATAVSGDFDLSDVTARYAGLPERAPHAPGLSPAAGCQGTRDGNCSERQVAHKWRVVSCLHRTERGPHRSLANRKDPAMFVPQGTPPLSGTSFARIAAELGLTAPTQPRPKPAVPAQRSSRSGRVEVTAAR